jgi:hypothetical protein
MQCAKVYVKIYANIIIGAVNIFYVKNNQLTSCIYIAFLTSIIEIQKLPLNQ